jgi:hypothetical protein
MASRLLGKVVPGIFAKAAMGDPERRGSGSGEFDKIEPYLRAKFPGAQRSILGTPFSFACVFADNPRAIRLIVAGDYLCLHKSRSGVKRVFGAQQVSEDVTIRQDEAGYCKSVVIAPQPGDRILICNPLFDSPYLTSDIYEALSAHSVAGMAQSAWQNATIKGLSGNIALAAIEICAAAPEGSELQPQLGVE